ncbi:hypothetical protein HPB51_025327 [Rhipicephalus microplus]|uniref:Uncharacterized protein n=1 Tax=Rhipicephalus microplus TaxID=6941 RepID=A0A9J6DE66_RHIMP|nr:hypothetical protein HPB51_025327 [Rhipicephalus microplus]
MSLEPRSPAGFSSPTGIAGCRGPHTVAMQAPSSISLKRSLSYAELGAPATLPPWSIATRFEEWSAIKSTTPVTFILSFPRLYRALLSRPSWISSSSTPTTDTTQYACHECCCVCSQVYGMDYCSNTIASAGVVKSFAWSDAVETSGSAAPVCRWESDACNRVVVGLWRSCRPAPGTSLLDFIFNLRQGTLSY